MSPTFSAQSSVSRPAPSVAAASSWTSAGYGTGGVALRNRGTGNINVSGVVGAVKAAYIYWAVIDGAVPTPTDQSIIIQHLPNPCAGISCIIAPTGSAPVTLQGTLIGSGPQPCWIGTTIYVYKAAVPSSVATGNGSYQVTLLSGSGVAGSVAGEDPWVAFPVLPLWEGASIVMVGSGTGTVNLFDTGLAGTMFIPPFSYTLTLSGTTTGAVQWDNIGADGQLGGGRNANAFTSGETTTINGVQVAGPGSALNVDSDWNGSSGLPIPQLWDDTGHFFFPAATPTLNVSIGPSGDCLVAVANVVQF